MEHFIGIDLGTTYSAVSTIDEYGKPIIIKNCHGENLTPSVVYFDEHGNAIAGAEAKETMLSGEDNVITVPAYFNDLQRNETIRAAQSADLEVLRIINEPTVAAINYGITQDADQKLLVYDLGGGTFDDTVLEVKNGVINVLATNVDEAVCLGAGIQASLEIANQNIRRGLPQGTYRKLSLPSGKNLQINDVMSHSLGAIAVSQDGNRYINSIIIRKNKTIPISESRYIQRRNL